MTPKATLALLAALTTSAFIAACGGRHEGTAPRTSSVFTVPAKLPPAKTSRTATTAAPPAQAPAPPRPPIVEDLIPFPQHRKAEMAAYAQRHYGIGSYALSHPHVIVEHVAVAPTAAAVKATFAPDVADPELHELPGVCSHFVIDRDGTIHQLVSLSLMCRHTVGLNYTAIGIEHAGFTDQDVLSDSAELAASIRLTSWLRCRYGIPIRDVIGHNESLSSPYHHENVAALRAQTHADMQHASMVVYRRRLASHPCR
jgi:N-acetylmuramoyl-L-alanine amidase